MHTIQRKSIKKEMNKAYAIYTENKTVQKNMQNVDMPLFRS